MRVQLSAGYDQSRKNAAKRSKALRKQLAKMLRLLAADIESRDGEELHNSVFRFDRYYWSGQLTVEA